MEQNKLKRAISFEAISFEILHSAVEQNSNIINIRRMSSLKGKVMLFRIPRLYTGPPLVWVLQHQQFLKVWLLAPMV